MSAGCSAQSFEGPRGQYRQAGPELNRQGGPAQAGSSESTQTRRRAAADQVSHWAASEPAIFSGYGRHEVWTAGRRRASNAARLQGNAGTRMWETVRGRTRKHSPAGPEIPECVPGREIGRFTSDSIYVRDVVAQWSRHQADRHLIASSNHTPRVTGGALAVWPGCRSEL
jgi:hypothetical protein